MNHDIKPSEDKQLLDSLIKYNLTCLEDNTHNEIRIFLKNHNDLKIAGLIGKIHGNWFEIEYIWVHETLRKQGIGRCLVSYAERESKLRGCKYVFLNTFSFQAPKFYEKLGYIEKIVKDAYPLKGSRHYFAKKI